MRGEIYVLSLMRLSETARSVAMQYLQGPVTHSSVIEELTHPERLFLAADRYGEIATRLAEAFEPPPLPRFSQDDVQHLLRPPVQRELARVLAATPRTRSPACSIRSAYGGAWTRSGRDQAHSLMSSPCCSRCSTALKPHDP